MKCHGKDDVFAFTDYAQPTLPSNSTLQPTPLRVPKITAIFHARSAIIAVPSITAARLNVGRSGNQIMPSQL